MQQNGGLNRKSQRKGGESQGGGIQGKVWASMVTNDKRRL